MKISAIDKVPAYSGKIAHFKCKSAEDADTSYSGSANTKMLLALLGRSSGARVLSPELTSELPVLTAMYCLPFTA
jgi:hypothetical protein